MPKPTALLKGFERAVATARPAAKRQVIFDGATTGLALIVTPKGKMSFSIVARDPAGKQVWKRIGDPAQMTVAKARQEAAEAVARVKAGEAAVLPPEPPEAAPESFQSVVDNFLIRHVDKQAFRSAREMKRIFRVYVTPKWKDRVFTELKRGDVARLLDEVEDNNGPVMATRVLAALSKLFNWYASREDDYSSPIVRGMGRANGRERARKRILTDDELRKVWAACGDAGTYGALVKAALLTAQRREKVATMRWQDIEGGVWKIPAKPREKPNAGELKLPKLALEIIESQPKIEGNPYVFAGRGKKAFNSHSAGQKDLRTVAPIDHWQFHDLRRTAKSLMARAGVRPDISERVLGHAIAGVEGVYDRHGYLDEKGAALAALASLVERILQGESDNVVQLAARQ